MKRKDFAEKWHEMAENSIDELIDLLAAPDWQTRFFAEMCLRDAAST